MTGRGRGSPRRPARLVAVVAVAGRVVEVFPVDLTPDDAGATVEATVDAAVDGR